MDSVAEGLAMMVLMLPQQLLLGLLCVIALIGCSPADGPVLPEQTLTLRLGSEPKLLNPLLSTDATSSQVEGYLYNGLFALDASLNLEPDLVSTYSVSSDGTHYRFKLRQDVHWHDGVPFSAHDVKFTFDKVLDPSTQTVRRSGFMINDQPIQFNVIDDHTIDAVLPEPYAPFLIRASIGIIPKHLFVTENINTSARNRNPIGTGPFIFDRWETQQYIVLKANPNYHLEAPKLEALLLKIIPDNNTAQLALIKGEIDAAALPPKDIPRIQKKDYLRLFTVEGLSYSYMGFNLKNKHFQDPLVRQAIAHSVNRDAIVRGVLKGYGRVAHLPSSPVSWAYPDDDKIVTYDYDPKRANQLFKQAGYVMNPHSNLLEKNDTPLRFTLMISQGSKTTGKIAEIIQAFLRQQHIDMRIQQLEWHSFLAIINANQDPKEFDAALLGWSLGADPDSFSIWHSSQYPKGFNFIGYKNPIVDDGLSVGRRQVSRKERAKTYQRLYSEIAKDLPYLFLTYPKSVIAVNNKVKGIPENPGPGGVFHDITDVYIEPLSNGDLP